MSSPTLPALQQLRRLDGSSSGFCDQLSGVLYGEEYKQCVPDLRGDDLVWFVDYLDKVPRHIALARSPLKLAQALNDLDPCDATFRKCLCELRGVCGKSEILPTSYMLSPSLLNIGPIPSTSGGFSDAYEGTFDGIKVCIKRVRIYSKEDLQNGTGVCCRSHHLPRSSWLTRFTDLLPRGRHVEILDAPKHCTSARCNDHTVPAYLELDARGRPTGIPQEQFRRESTWTCRCPPKFCLSLAYSGYQLSDIAKGLRYLHSCSVVHGDLKGVRKSNSHFSTALTLGQLNILVDDTGSARIVDFGLATVTRNPDSMRSVSDQHGNTPRWTAPEVLNGEAYSKEADIFSFAMVMIEVCRRECTA